MPAEQDFYHLLGVPREAPDREIKRAYYELARQLHPDKAGSPEEAKRNSDRLAAISQAYNTLKDPEKRKEYDASSAGKGAAPKAASPSPSAPAAAGAASGASGSASSAPGVTAPGGGKDSSNRVSGKELDAQRKAMAQKAFVRGMQHFKAAEFEKARPLFEAAIQNDPDSEPHYFHKYAQCLIRLNKSFNKAVEAAERAAQMDNYNIEFKLTLGELYEAAGVASKAKAVYEDVIRWDESNIKAKQRLAGMSTKAEAGKPLLEKLLPTLFGKKK